MHRTSKNRLSQQPDIRFSRRDLLATSFATGLLASFSPSSFASNERTLISAASDRKGQHWAISLGESGELISKTKLPARAHEILKHPKRNEVAIIGRRPGQYLILSSIKSGRIIKHIEPEQGYHFYGHALFSKDGRFLVTSENHIHSGQGHIFVRDAENDYQIYKHFPSYGIGPHEMKISRDQDSLVIANGGILTHPDKGREKLNLDTMSPSLSYVSLQTGALLEQVQLDKQYHQLSIRHLDINHNDDVIVGMQYQGDLTDQVPLVASHKRGQDLKPLWAPESVIFSMKQYCGSVCFDLSGKTAAISSPKGNLITFWDYRRQTFISSLRCKDGCGIASYNNNQFIISNGLGNLFHYNTKNKELRKTRPNLGFKISWDNHLAVT